MAPPGGKLGGKLGGKGARGPFWNNIVADATDYNLIANLGDDDWHYQSEEEDLSYTFGVLADDFVPFEPLVLQFDDAEALDENEYSFGYWQQDDVVIAADQIQGWVDDEQPTDETEYGYSFQLIEDAQVYAAQFDETDDEAPDYDFTYWQQDDVVAAPDQIGQAFDDGEDEPQEYDFYASPLSANFTFVDEIPYAAFEDLDENYEGEEYSFYFGVLSDDATTTIAAIPLGPIGPWRTDKQERARQRRFKEIAEAELELRDALGALVRGDKTEVQVAFDRAIENVEAAQDEATPYFIEQLESLRADIARLTTMATVRQTQIKLAADHAAHIRQMMDDDEAITILLLN